MKYALLVYVDPTVGGDADEASRAAIIAEYMAVRDDSRVTAGEHLHDPGAATTVRVEGGESLLTDGPFADTKEFFGGYYVVEADDIDAAVEIAARVPAARMGRGAVEVRPVMG